MAPPAAESCHLRPAVSNGYEKLDDKSSNVEDERCADVFGTSEINDSGETPLAVIPETEEPGNNLLINPDLIKEV